MPRNFGLRQTVHRFWNEDDGDLDARWPFYVIGATALIVVLFGIFIA